MKNKKRKKNNADFDEWYKSLAEFCEGITPIFQEGEYKDDTYGNPYGAGGFGFIRSATSKRSLVYKEIAEYNPRCNKWFEYITYGCSCGADCDYEGDWYALDRDDFDRKHPRIVYKEAYYRFTYGDTRDEVAEAMILLIDHNKGKSRMFSFNLENITKQEFQEYFEAIENWHCTGELNIGPYHGLPAYGPWRKH